MARYHEIEASIWSDMEDFSKNAKILYIYAFSNSSVRDSGLYKIGEKNILLDTGLSKRDFEGALKELYPKVAYDKENKVMFVSGKLKRRLSGLVNNRNVIKSIQHDLDAFSGSFVTSLFIKKYEGALEGLGSLSLPLPLPLPLSLNNKKEEKIQKPTENKMPPDVQDVISFFKEKGHAASEAEKFWNHHDARGWTLKGGLKMKNWRSACFTWFGNIKKFDGQSSQEEALAKRLGVRV